MTHDTSRDPRILVAQRACALLKKSVKQKHGVQIPQSKERIADLASTCESSVMMLLYMYLEPDALLATDPMKALSAAASELGEAYAPWIGHKDAPPMVRATLRWCLRTLTGLPDRLKNPGKTLASGVDLVVVKVANVAGKGALRTTRVSDGEADYTVVTNLENVEGGALLAAAFLPPREVGGVVSEAMFLGAEKRNESAGTVLTEDHVDAREAASVLHEELAKRA